MTTLAIFGGIGVPELILILVIVLIVFGAGKLPQIGDALGKGIRNFKKSSSGDEELQDATPRKRLDGTKTQEAELEESERELAKRR